MPPSKKRKLTDLTETPEDRESRQQADAKDIEEDEEEEPAVDLDTADKHVRGTTDEQQADEHQPSSATADAVARTRERQDRFKALQARAVSRRPPPKPAWFMRRYPTIPRVQHGVR